MISWIDNSPEALRRQDALKKKERQDRGDEEREWRGINEQIARARKEGQAEDEDEDEPARTLQRREGKKIKLSFGTKKSAPATEEASGSPEKKPPSPPLTENDELSSEDKPTIISNPSSATDTQTTPLLKPSAPSTTPKPQNVFASAPKKNNPLAMAKRAKPAVVPSKPRSEAERIMREEIERKQRREANGNARGGGGFGGNTFKRQRVA